MSENSLYYFGVDVRGSQEVCLSLSPPLLFFSFSLSLSLSLFQLLRVLAQVNCTLRKERQKGRKNRNTCVSSVELATA